MKNTLLFVISRAVYTMAADLKITYGLAEICRRVVGGNIL